MTATRRIIERREQTDGTVLKPLSEVEAAINATSAGDFLLFMIAMEKKSSTIDPNKKESHAT